MAPGFVEILAGAQYALRVEQAMRPGERRTRFAKARALVADQIGSQFAAHGVEHPLVGRLLRDNTVLLNDHFNPERALDLLLAAWASNPVAPYEIKIDATVKRTALANLATDLGLTTNWARVAESAHKSAAEAHGGADVARIALVVAGVAAVVAAPALVLAAAPAGVAGGAALVGGLAALGPGGMLGGLAVVGAVGGIGGTVATGALTAGTSAEVQKNVLLLQARALARQKLQQAPSGYREWFLLCTLESQVASERRRLEKFSDSNSSAVKDLSKKLKHIQNAQAWMLDRGLGPKELPARQMRELAASEPGGPSPD